MKITKEYKKYIVRDSGCKKKSCFLPYEGNGRKICRLYEVGRCPDKVKKIDK